MIQQLKLDQVTLAQIEALAKKARKKPDQYVRELIGKMYAVL